MKYRLVEKTEEVFAAYSQGSEWIDVGAFGADSYALISAIDVQAPVGTFDSGVAASLIVQDLTYTADVRGVAGDAITIAYTAGGTAGAEVVTVVGTAISVSISVTPVVGSTATQIKTAVDASVAASALISVAVSGTGSNVQAAAAVTPLASGAESEVDVTENTVTIPDHGFGLGLKGRLTTTGTLPAGVTTGVDYYIIVVDADTVQFASSLAHAQGGTAIDLTNQGSDGAVNTFTATAIAGASIKLQQANNTSYPVDLGSATNITVDATVSLEKDRPTMRYVRAYLTLTAGQISAPLQILVKGDRNG